MAGAIDADAYLSRIGHRGARDPTATVLRALHAAHMEAVPFENLDIHLGRPIVLDEDALFEKIVRERRGGFCYELNGLFSALLRELGFRVTRLSAGVLGEGGDVGPDFDHMTLLVELEQRWLADVGFGDSFREPLRLDEPGDQARDGRIYRVAHDGRHGWMHTTRAHDGRPSGYRFTFTGHALADYAVRCRYHQSSPDSPFTQQWVCTRATPTGRITLSGRRLIVTDGGRRWERDLTDDEWRRALTEQFGLGLHGLDPAAAPSNPA